MFASTLNGITASVRCVSSMIEVLSAKLTRLIAAHANKKPVRYEEAWQECSDLLFKTHWRLTSIAVLTVHAKMSIIYFPTIYASQ